MKKVSKYMYNYICISVIIWTRDPASPPYGGEVLGFRKTSPPFERPRGGKFIPPFWRPRGGEVEKTSPPYGGEVSKKILRISDLRNTGLPLKNSVLEG